jgi:protein-disulfide isomerase
MTKALFLTVAVTLLACSSAPAQQGSDTAARVGDRTITMKELDDRWKAANPSEHAAAMQQMYEGRRHALDQIVADMLLAEAGKAKKLSGEAYAQAEIAKRIKPITDAEVATFYQQNISQMQGRSLEAMAPLINRYLQEQQESTARDAVIAELRKSGPPLRVTLAPPRFEVTLAATDPAVGAASAPVTVIEFSDFECPFCQRVAPTLKKIREAYGDKVRLVWKDFPLTQIHPSAFKAGEAGHCAAEQGRFWEFHDRLFANQQALGPDALKGHASSLSLDTAKFNACLDSSKYSERVRDGIAQGTRLGVNSTPTIYINGRMVSGAQPYEVIAGIIDEELSRK